MDKTRQLLVGMGAGLAVLLGVFLDVPSLPLVAGVGAILLVIGLVVFGWFWLTNRQNPPGQLPERLFGMRYAAAGLALPPLVLLPILLAISLFTQPPSPCSTRQAPGYARPAALVTAEDYFAQGNYDYDRGDCQAALADYSQAIDRNPNYAQAYNNRAYTYMILRDYASALPDLDRAIQIRPGYVNALMNRGDIHNFYYAIDYQKAIADYDHVISLGALHTSVCGHRLLAVHHGWNLSAIAEVLRRGSGAGCPAADNVQ